MTIPSDQGLPGNLGQSMYELIRDLYPINRSITGEGVRRTLDRLSDLIDLQVTEVPTGTRVLDWQIPMEWSIEDAYIKDKSGNRVVDYRKSNLHVVGYSVPVSQNMRLEELRPHLHSIPEYPDWIPYRTSYYSPNWGFCLSHRTLEAMKDSDYEVRIDSKLQEGSLNYAEHLIRGRSEQEVLFFSHICHPSLCNDNLSGVALLSHLARELGEHDLHFSYRFVFAPATIGSIAWLARNEELLPRIRHGLVVTVVGDAGHIVYKRSRLGSAEIDKAVEHVLQTTTDQSEILPFTPWGYDERQFCSPGINLPVGRFTRTPNGCYPEYHTSADDLGLVAPEYLTDSLKAVWRVVEVLEKNRVYVNTEPKGEPQLGRRGLYQSTGGYQNIADRQLAMLWVLNQSDGSQSLLDIAVRSGLDFPLVASVADESIAADLLAERNSSAQLR